MGFWHGPHTNVDGLILCYDTGNKKSYLREPTTNLMGTTFAQSGWEGNYSVIDSNTKTFNLTVSYSTSASAWRTFYIDVSSYVGQYITISCDFSFVIQSNATYSSFTIGQGNTGDFPLHILGSSASDRVTITNTNSQHLTWSGIINATGIVGFTMWIGNATPGGYVTAQVSNVQVEQKDHETPFINGSLSYTDALKDISKENTTFNLSQMSFDSNGTPLHDGNGTFTDYIDLGSDITFKSGGGWTVENWFYCNTVPGSYNNTTSPGNFLGYASINTSSWYWSILSNKLAIWNISPGAWYYGNTTIQVSTWYQAVLVCEDGGTTYNMYLNGQSDGTHAGLNATYASLKGRYIGAGNSGNPRTFDGYIPITKIYNKALSSTDIKNNFDTMKKRFGL